jgi:tripartite-type tricarboxylate transporter receptor subunit TctC
MAMIKKFAVISLGLILAVIAAATGCPPPGAPATPAEFYKGKTIDLTTTGSAGTFNDLSAHIIASYLGRTTGANVTVTNREGAGSLEGTNYVYKARPDGLTLGTVASVKFITNKVMDEPVAEYDLAKFSYIMSLDRQPYCFFVSPEGPYQSVADLQAGQDLKFGATSPSGPTSLGGLTVIKLLGLDARVITGFGGIDELPLVTGRGEVVGYCLSISNARAGVEVGLVKPLFVLSTERSPLIPDVPAITELVNLSDQNLALVKLWGNAFAASNLFIAPPDMPEDRLAFLRRLADQWIGDEAFRQEISQAAGYEVQVYLTGDEVNQTIMETVARLDEFRALFTDLILWYRA